jgi:hypothetical protein
LEVGSSLSRDRLAQEGRIAAADDLTNVLGINTQAQTDLARLGVADEADRRNAEIGFIEGSQERRQDLIFQEEDRAARRDQFEEDVRMGRADITREFSEFLETSGLNREQVENAAQTNAIQMFAIMQDAEDAVAQMDLLKEQLTQRKAESSDKAEQDKLDSLITLIGTF